MFKIAYYEIKKMVRNYRFLIILFLEPIVLIALLGAVNFYEPRDISVGVVNLNSNEYSRQVVNSIANNNNLKVEFEDTKEALIKKIDTDKYRSAVIVDMKQNLDGNTEGKITIIDNQTVPEMSLRAKEKILDSIKDPVNDIVIENAEKTISTASDNEIKVQSDQMKENAGKLSQSIFLLENSGIDTKDIQKQINNIGIYTAKPLKVEIVSEPVKVESQNNSPIKINYFDFTASAVIILLIILISLNISATTITSERSGGTFERFFSTPFKKYQFIGGKMIAYISTSLMLTLVSIAALTILFDVHIGNIFLVISLTFITSLVSTALGILISSLTYSISESVQISAMVFLAILISTQFIFHIESMHPLAKYFSFAIPFTYAIKSMREVNILNLGFTDIYPTFIILFIFFIVFLFFSTVLLKRKSG